MMRRKNHTLCKIPISLCITLTILYFYFNFNYNFKSSFRQIVKSPSIPPPLANVVQHHRRPSVLQSPRPEWKRPNILTAHAIQKPNQSHLEVAIFSTGTDTQSYGRTFTPVACMIGSRVFNISIFRPEVTVCEVFPHPKPGDLISILLRLDRNLQQAITQPVTLANELFELLPGDVEPMFHCSSSTERAVAKVRSDVLWQNSMIDNLDQSKPRYELCLMTAMKQYPYLLDPFVQYYRRLGVDQFYIYDNYADSDIATYMGKYQYVQVIFWPWTRSQMQSFTHFTRAAQARCKFVAFFDADEFIMVGKPGLQSLKYYVRLRSSLGHKQIISHFVRFLNNNFVRKPSGNLPELYTRREKNQKITLGKSIIDTDHQFYFHKIHIVEGAPGSNTYWNISLDLNPTSLEHNAMLMHYTERSWEEFVLKNRYGGSSPMTRDRKPTELDITSPDPEYMDVSKTVPFNGFAQRWGELMKTKLPRCESLVWKTADLWCQKLNCINSRQKIATPTCASNLQSLTPK